MCLLPTVIHVVEILVGVVRVVDHEWTPQSIAILRGKMAVVPIGACECDVSIKLTVLKRAFITRLIGGLEVVQERISAGDGALVDEGRSVGPIGALLEKTVPVLQQGHEHQDVNKFNGRKHTILVDFSMVWLSIWSITFSWKRSPCTKRH